MTQSTSGGQRKTLRVKQAPGKMGEKMTSGKIVTGKMVTGLFRDRDSVERAYQAVTQRGYDNSDINLLMSDETRRRYFPDGGQPGNHPHSSELAGKAAETVEQPPKGNELGGPAGGTAGTIAPIIAAVGTLMLIPGLLIAGPVAIALAAAGAVGVAGGLVGALTDWGVPKGRVEEYEASIRDGGMLLGVKPRSDEDAEYIEREWQACGGELVHR